MASTMDKIKDKVAQVTHTGPYSDKPVETTTGTAVGGTHNPEIHHTTAHHTPAHQTDPHTGLTGSHNTGVGTVGSTTVGPHDSNLANKLDPRVDSDRDGSRNAGLAGGVVGTTSGLGQPGTHTAHSGLGHTTGSTTTAGPHSSNLANKLDPRVDSDLDRSRNAGLAGGAVGGTTGLAHGTHATQPGAAYTTGITTAGPHSSNLANKLDPRVDSDFDGSRNAGLAGGAVGTTPGLGHGTHTTHTGMGHTSATTTAGPHDSNLANKLDPRVDSDLDGSRNVGLAGGVGTTTTTGYGHTGAHAPTTTTTGFGQGPASNTAGPHSSNLANKLDPRVDSDLDSSRNVGMAGGVGAATTTTGYGHTGAHTTTTGYGHTGAHTTTTGFGQGPATTTAGPHSSNLANKLDPRVDSDLDGSRKMGTTGGVGTTTTTTTGGLSSHAPHKGIGHDPTYTGVHEGVGVGGPVGGVGHAGGIGHAGGPGPAPTTAGPHSSDLMNKLDPRVDSDLDGSRTVGGNATYQ